MCIAQVCSPNEKYVARYDPRTVFEFFLLLSKERTFILNFIFFITAADFVPCGGPKMSPCVDYILRLVF